MSSKSNVSISEEDIAEAAARLTPVVQKIDEIMDQEGAIYPTHMGYEQRAASIASLIRDLANEREDIVSLGTGRIQVTVDEDGVFSIFYDLGNIYPARMMSEFVL